MRIFQFRGQLMAALLAFLTTMSGHLQAETLLRFASWAPPSHPQNRVVIPTWAQWVQEATEGRVRVVVDYDLGHPKTMFDIVEDGVADASWSYHGYVPGRFILPMAAELPGMNADTEAASIALWRTYNRDFITAGEFSGLTLLGLFTHGPGQLHTRKPITSWDQLKGMKIRVGGGIQSRLGERLEIAPVSAPATKVYEMMQQGVIDGVFLTLSDQKGLRLFEVAPYVTVVPNGMYSGTFSMFINPDFLASLDPRDAQAIMAVSGERLSAMAGRAWALGCCRPGKTGDSPEGRGAGQHVGGRCPHDSGLSRSDSGHGWRVGSAGCRKGGRCPRRPAQAADKRTQTICQQVTLAPIPADFCSAGLHRPRRNGCLQPPSGNGQTECKQLVLAGNVKPTVSSLAIGQHTLSLDAQIQRDAIGAHPQQDTGAHLLFPLTQGRLHPVQTLNQHLDLSLPRHKAGQ